MFPEEHTHEGFLSDSKGIVSGFFYYVCAQMNNGPKHEIQAVLVLTSGSSFCQVGSHFICQE